MFKNKTSESFVIFMAGLKKQILLNLFMTGVNTFFSGKKCVTLGFFPYSFSTREEIENFVGTASFFNTCFCLVPISSAYKKTLFCTTFTPVSRNEMRICNQGVLFSSLIHV